MKEARKSPDFLKGSVLYQIFLRAFTPEGTLAAAAEMLPHLKSLGVDIVYLCPVALADDDTRSEYWSVRQKASCMDNPCNPYRIKDFFTVDTEYGDDADLKAFIKTAHSLNLRVLLDLVYLHCGPMAVFLEAHPDFVVRDEKGEISLGEWSFPLLNFQSVDLREYLWSNMEYFVREFEVDGYRCDAATKIPLDFWEVGRHRLEVIRPDIIMLSEGDRPDDQFYAFDLSYGFPWYTALHRVFDGDAPATEIQNIWRKMHDEFPEGARFTRILDSHDIANDMSLKGVEYRFEKRWGSQGVDAALVLNFIIDGIPFLYNGIEVADTAIHNLWANRFTRGNCIIDWWKAMTKIGKNRIALIKELSNLRHTLPALGGGVVGWIPNSMPEHIIVFTRTLPDQQLLCVVNTKNLQLATVISVNSLSTPVVLFEYTDCWESRDGKLYIELPPYGFALFKIGV